MDGEEEGMPRLPVKAILKAAAAAACAIDRASDPDICDYNDFVLEELESLGEVCGQFRWAYPLRLRRAAASARNRCLPQLSGPLFTSDRHPWPFVDGQWLAPIVQMDLAQVGAIGNVALGSGMLQLWTDDMVGHLRIVPADEITLNGLTAVPSGAIAAAENWRFVQREDLTAATNFHKTTFLITGHGPAALSPPDMLEIKLDECLRHPLEPRLFAALNKFGDLIGRRRWSDTEPHWFGNFQGIQYDVSEKPPALLALSTDARFMWGDIGNAQIFYDLSRQGVERFSFDWSC